MTQPTVGSTALTTGTPDPLIRLSPIATAAARELARGFVPVLIAPREKKPAGGQGWQHIRYTLDDGLDSIFTRNHNIGLNLGASRLVDIDLDSMWTRKLAREFLPETGMVWGRKSAPSSHFAYHVGGEMPTYLKYVGVGDKPECLLERRTGDGHQTVIPPSIHKETGERIEWVTNEQPAEEDAETLGRAVNRLAACALIASVWRDNIRHDLALGFAGFLMKAGLAAEDAERLIVTAADAANDDEITDRVTAIRDTAHRIEAGEAVEGARKLLQVLPDVARDVMAKLEEWLGLTATRKTEKPIIVTNQYKDWDDLNTETLLKVTTVNQPCPTLFHREAKLTRVRWNERGHPLLEPLTEAALKGHLASIILWLSATRSGYRPVQPPDDVVKTLLARSAWPGIPPLRDIVQAPVFAPDGTIITTPGYHPGAKLWYDPQGHLDIVVPAQPSVTDICAARELLVGDLLGDFVFDSDASRANALAVILMPFARALFDGPTPLHLVTAPVQGSGKGLLVDVVSYIVTGREAEISTMPDNDEEMRKRITAILRRSSPIIVIDNVKGTLEGPGLEAVLTTTNWMDRVLGVSQTTGGLPNYALWLATGNNVEMSTDIARRTVTVRLDPNMERPWERTGFRHDPLMSWVKENRSDLVSAALTLIQAWLATGRPKAEHPPIGTFERWAHTLAGILAVAGVPGFLTNYRAMYEKADQEMDPWRMFVANWWETHGNKHVTAADLLPLTAGLLDAEVAAPDYALRRAKLALAIRKYDGRIIGGYRIVAHTALKRRTYSLLSEEEEQRQQPKVG
jgi:Bifunctional DNA primase/polymerase, N-terminal